MRLRRRERPQWKPHYDARLRRYFAFPDKLTDEQLAELFDYEFSPDFIKQQRHRLGLRRIVLRPWTPEEDRRLRELAYTMSWEEIAAVLGRSSITSAFQRAAKLGITRPLKGRLYAALGLTDFIIEKHARGWCDTEIEAAWNRRHRQALICRSCISARRRKLGLPNNALHERRRRRVGKKTREQLQGMGLKNLAQLRVHSWGRFAARAGWPGYRLRPRAVQVLNLLYDRGPHTRRQICEALGLRWRTGRCNGLNANGGRKYPGVGSTYLSELEKAGLVVRLNRAVRTGRRGGNVSLYAVAPHVKRSSPCPQSATA